MTLGSLWNLAQFLHTLYKRGLTMRKNGFNLQVMHLLLTSILSTQANVVVKMTLKNASCIVSNWSEIAGDYSEGII